MKPIIYILLLGSSLFISCRSSKNKRGGLRTMDTVSISATQNPLKIYRATTDQAWNIVHTRVALSFDYKNRTANGQEWLTLQPYFYPTDSLCLDAKGMKIESVTIGHADKALKYRYDSSQIHIQLDKVYTKEELVKLTIKYVAMPYATASGGSAAITGDRGLYFINHDAAIEGKPIQIWTQGETESNSHWLPTIDKPNSRTTLQIELTVPMRYKTLSNGALVSSMDNGITRTDIWKMDKPIQVYAIMFAIGDFYIAKDKWRDKEVNYYVEPSYAPYAHKMFQYTPEMIEYFSNITGVPYPWNKYSQVVVRDYVSGAMENTSASLFGEFMNQDHREYADANHEDVVSHELFHQWFGDYVTAESWSHLTVNESFATYGEYLWRKYKYGSNYADELAWGDLQRYLSYTDYADPVLVRHYYRDKEDMFDRVSYQKGGAILHYAHQLMGDSAFCKAMQIYLTKNALHAAEATHWRLAIEEVTGKDWNWFFNQWYNRAGHPILDIQYDYDDVAKQLKVTVGQTQKEALGLYDLPLKTLLVSGAEKTVLDWHISKRKETFTYAYKNGIAPLIVPDMAHVLPGIIIEHKNYKEWLAQINICDDYVSKLLAVENVQTKDLNKIDASAILSQALKTKTAAIREAALEKIKQIDNEASRNKWKQDVVMLATNDGNNTARALALEILGNWKAKEQASLMIEALNDSSYLVAGNALYALNSVNDSLAYNLAKQHLRGKANTHLHNKAWAIIAEHAQDSDTLLFRSAVQDKNDLTSRKQLIVDLAKFSMNTKNLSVFSKTIDWLGQKISETENKNYRAYYANMLNTSKETAQRLANKDKKNTLYLQKIQIIRAKAQELRTAEKEQEVQELYDNLLK